MLPCDTEMYAGGKLESIERPASSLEAITEAVDVEQITVECDHGDLGDPDNLEAGNMTNGLGDSPCGLNNLLRGLDVSVTTKIFERRPAGRYDTSRPASGDCWSAIDTSGPIGVAEVLVVAVFLVGVHQY